MGDVIALRPGLVSGSWEVEAPGGEPGEQLAARLVFLIHEPALRRRALRLACVREAELLLRDTFDRYLDQGERLGSATGLVVWLFTVMKDLFVARSQRKRRLRVVRTEGAPVEPVHPPGWARVTRTQFAGLVAALPPDLRQVFQLHAVEGLSYGEIGAELDLTPLAVFARLYRARLLLKDMLRDLLEGEGSRDVGV